MSNRWNNKVWDKISKEDLISLVNDLWILSEKYEEQIHNAIEYISEYRNGWNNWFEFTIDDKLKLLDILKGSDKE